MLHALGAVLPAAHPAALVLAGLGAAVVVAATVGVLVMPTALDRLHYVSAASTLGVGLVGIGATAELGVGRNAAKVIITTALLMGIGPAVAHATARVALLDEQAPMSEQAADDSGATSRDEAT